jgi:hypothetical protein
VVTNIVIFDVYGTGKTTTEICARVKLERILAIGFGDMIRMVTHCNVVSEDIEETIFRMRTILD